MDLLEEARRVIEPDIFRELSDSVIGYTYSGTIVFNAALLEHDNRVYLQKLCKARQLGIEAILEIHNGNERIRCLTNAE